MSQDLSEGSILADRYVIEQRLGDGSMGTVYRARHVKFGREFAIKVLHRSLTDDPKVLRRFEREAELAGRLRHTNVAAVVDVGATVGPAGAVHFMAMEFAPGTSIAALLDDGAISETRLLDLVKQLCSGLQHAHDVGLIHRDFKPENVIIEQLAGGREIARIVDWGVAILLDDAGDPEGERLTTKGIVLGTPHYMAPEQARGISLDHRVDIYALGLMCYELLTGVLPFDGDGVDIARANLESPTPPMRERAPHVHVDPVLEALVRHLLEKDPDARPPSADAVRELFELYDRDRAGCALLLGAELPEDMQRADAPAEGSTPGEPAAHHADPERERDTATIAPQRERRRLALVAGIFAGALAILLWLGLRGGEEHGPPAAGAGVRDEVTVMPIVQEGSAETAPSSPVALAEEPPVTVPVQAAVRRPGRVAARTEPATPPRRTAPPPSAAEVATLYGALGRELKVLEDAHGMESTIDLWPRYRWIRINEWLGTPERRAKVARILEQLRSDARAGR